MLGLSRVVVLSTLLLSALATPTHTHDDDDATNWQKFSALLDTVDEGALHRVLHAVYPKFKDGVFSKDRTAAEQVHSENPVMASKLVHIAKRQSNNETIPIPTTTASSTSQALPSDSPTTTASPSTPEQSSQVAQSSSLQASISSEIDSALSSQLTATSVPSPTSVRIAPSTPVSATPISTESGGVVFSSEGGGVVTVTSPTVSVRFTPSTSTHLYYTTLPNGRVSTATTLVVVNAPVTGTVDSTDRAATTSAGLQNGGAKNVVGSVAGLMVGALGVVAAF